MAIPLEPVSLDEWSAIRAKFFRGRSPRAKGWNILVVTYEGIYRPGDPGDANARHMHAMGEAGVRAWEAYGVILDLSGVDYRGDSRNDSLFSIGEKAFGNEGLPLAVVVGPKSERAIPTILFGPGGRAPDQPWGDRVFRDFDSAWAYVEEGVAASREGFHPARPDSHA